jgi:hypothetical protein
MSEHLIEGDGSGLCWCSGDGCRWFYLAPGSGSAGAAEAGRYYLREHLIDPTEGTRG